VHAAQRGRVVLADELFFAGNTVVLDHGLGIYTFYGHLSEISAKVGDILEVGDVLGKVGATRAGHGAAPPLGPNRREGPRKPPANREATRALSQHSRRGTHPTRDPHIETEGHLRTPQGSKKPRRTGKWRKSRNFFSTGKPGKGFPAVSGSACSSGTEHEPAQILDNERDTSRHGRRPWVCR